MNIPLWQVLVEGRGTREHGPHVSDDRRIPLWQVLVEGRCTREHGAHVGRHVLLWQVLVRTTCCEARVPLEEITCLGQAGCQAYSTRAWCFTVHGTCRFGAVQTHAALYLSCSICRDTLITNQQICLNKNVCAHAFRRTWSRIKDDFGSFENVRQAL